MEKCRKHKDVIIAWANNANKWGSSEMDKYIAERGCDGH